MPESGILWTLSFDPVSLHDPSCPLFIRNSRPEEDSDTLERGICRFQRSPSAAVFKLCLGNVILVLSTAGTCMRKRAQVTSALPFTSTSSPN